MRSWRAHTVALGFGLFLPACALFLDTSGLSGGDPDAQPQAAADGAITPEAGASPSSDASASGDASSPSPDASGAVTLDATSDVAFDVVSSPSANLLTNPGFDLGVGVCGGGWGATGDFTSYDGSDIAHGPTKACKLCGPGRLLLGIDQVAKAKLGEQYLLEAWVRQADEGTAGVVLGLELDTESTTLEGRSAAVPTTWTKVSSTLTIDPGAAGKGLRFFVGGTKSNGVCVLIDDVSMTRL